MRRGISFFSPLPSPFSLDPPIIRKLYTQPHLRHETRLAAFRESRPGTGAAASSAPPTQLARGETYERLYPSISSLAVDHLHADGHRQLRRHEPGDAARLGDVFAVAAAVPAAVQRPLPVRAALPAPQPGVMHARKERRSIPLAAHRRPPA